MEDACPVAADNSKYGKGVNSHTRTFMGVAALELKLIFFSLSPDDIIKHDLNMLNVALLDIKIPESESNTPPPLKKKKTINFPNDCENCIKYCH